MLSVIEARLSLFSPLFKLIWELRNSVQVYMLCMYVVWCVCLRNRVREKEN